MHDNPNESNTHHLSLLLVVSHLTLNVKVKANFEKNAVERLRGNVSHSGQHGDAAVLQLGLTTSLEVLNAAIGSEASRIPEPHLLATYCNTETFCEASTKHCRKIIYPLPKELFLTLFTFLITTQNINNKNE